MDIHNKIKKDVLASLIEEMDGKMLDGLKSKSPKFMKVETNDPEMAEEIAEMEEEIPAEAAKDAEDKVAPKEEDEDIERLKEMYEKLK